MQKHSVNTEMYFLQDRQYLLDFIFLACHVKGRKGTPLASKVQQLP